MISRRGLLPGIVGLTVLWPGVVRRCLNFHSFSSAGGDDLALKGWDIRTPCYEQERAPIFTCKRGYVRQSSNLTKRFDGGVTSIQSHPLRQHYWAVGSYDEKLRLYDARQMRYPVNETHVGGGIWRAKWHPTLPQKLLLACMHGGLVVLDCAGLSNEASITEEPMEVVTRFDGHNSIAYGCDWERAAPNDHFIYSCSFYDASMHIWAW